jgi:3-oxoacyl-[acyl-carrier-protein] synthase-1
MVSALGRGPDETWRRLLAGDASGITRLSDLVPGREIPFGVVPGPLPPVSPALARFACRNNALALLALAQIEERVRAEIRRATARRFAVVVGTSTSGVAAAEQAFRHRREHGVLPESFDYAQLEHGGLARFLAEHLGVQGPAYTISTACSSSAKAIAAAGNLVALGVCDAALAGGVDSLCRLTLNGFDALQTLAPDRCNPMSANRKGLVLGEGGALFLLTRDGGEIGLLGAGESSDAHHMSAPEPEGLPTEAAMRAALAEAGVDAADVAYLNLHGTGTPLNDAMESRAVHRVFGERVPCSSTKPLTGHALGASAAVELGLCWLLLAHAGDGRMPLAPHVWDGTPDPALPRLRLARAGEEVEVGTRAVVVSNAFGFGGSNCTLVLGRDVAC